MPILNVIDNKHMSLAFHGDEKIVHSTLYKDLTSESFRTVMNTGLDLMKEHGAIKWLSDNRAFSTPSEDDRYWVNHDWHPRMIAAGWKYWGLVVPTDVKARMNLVEFVDSLYKQGVRIMVFTDLNEAKGWLINVDQQSPSRFFTPRI